MKLTLGFFLFFFIFIAISCEEEENNKPPVDNSCSTLNPSGDCEDNKSCINGICIYECSETLSCPEHYYHCDNNVCYDTTEPCSKDNYFGKCSSDKTCVEGKCKNLNPCSREYPTGICSSEDKSCYDGYCVEKTTECKPWNPYGSCPKDYNCKNGKCYHKIVEQACSLQYPDGVCDSDEDKCINGVCREADNTCGSPYSQSCPSGQKCLDGICYVDIEKPCGDYSFGYCSDENEKCYNGECYNIINDCSVDDVFGKCPKNYICNKGVCDSLLIECNEEKECPDLSRQYCSEDEKCLDKPIFCEDGAVNGLCPENEACVDSVCEKITEECSLSNPNGICDALNLKCLDGICLDSSQQGLCSDKYPEGKCPSSQECINKACEGDLTRLDIGNSCFSDLECKEDLYCEKTFLDGYCTKSCQVKSDCPETSNCYKTSSSIGYCLAKCSVNIPNSCDRENTENYICYPYDNNDGSCLYDCKYHGCFETGKTCNQITGICK